MPTNDRSLDTKDDDWLTMFCEEAWRQYVHENELAQT